jgi:hypothetical protein
MYLAHLVPLSRFYEIPAVPPARKTHTSCGWAPEVSLDSEST